jgi:hypothetical protein
MRTGPRVRAMLPNVGYLQSEMGNSGCFGSGSELRYLVSRSLRVCSRVLTNTIIHVASYVRTAARKILTSYCHKFVVLIVGFTSVLLFFRVRDARSQACGGVPIACLGNES